MVRVGLWIRGEDWGVRAKKGGSEMLDSKNQSLLALLFTSHNK